MNCRSGILKEFRSPDPLNPRFRPVPPWHHSEGGWPRAGPAGPATESHKA